MDIKDLEQDVEKPDEDSLARITHLAGRILEGYSKIAELEEMTKKYKKLLKQLEEKELPDLMLETGLKKFELQTGEKVTIKDIVAASISAANKPEAFEWLDQNGHGDLIKNEVKLKFGAGQEDIATEVVQELLEKGYEPNQVRSVHPQTLAAFVREQLDDGEDIPEDLLGVYVGRKAIIK